MADEVAVHGSGEPLLPAVAHADQRVVRKLAHEILPYVISAERLRRVPRYVAWYTFTWVRDILAFLSGTGAAGHTTWKAVAGDAPLPPTLVGLPTGIAVVIAVVAAAYAVLRAIVARDDGEKKAVLATSCRRDFQILGRRLRTALGKSDPMPDLVSLQAEIHAVVDRHMGEGSWPFQDTFADGISEDVASRTSSLVAQYHSFWHLAQDDEDRAEPEEFAGPDDWVGMDGALVREEDL